MAFSTYQSPWKVTKFDSGSRSDTSAFTGASGFVPSDSRQR